MLFRSETAKIPAFANYFPELNHNEMTGFDARISTAELSEKFHFIFLKDESDGSRIHKRMAIMERLLKDKRLEMDVIGVKGGNQFHKIFQNLLIADFAAYYLAKHYHLDPEKVPMVEEFKRLIA